jgi:hypothetical protein
MPRGATLSGSYHTQILSDVPEDSDVFHVLTRKPPVPETVGTQHFIYEVQKDGAIRIVKK